MINLEITGGDKVLQRYLGAGPRVRQAVNREISELTEQMAEEVRAKIATYTRSGRLLESIKTFTDYFTPGTIEGRVFIDTSIAPYGNIQERGGVTRPHPIFATGKALRFIGRSGDVLFRSMVNHPGSKIPGKHFMSETLAENRAYIISQLRGAARGAM